MTRQEAIQILKAKHACMERDTRGTDRDCNERNCLNCDLNYKQGTMGEQMEAFQMAIDALGSDNNAGCKGDAISRQAAIETALTFLVEYCGAAFDEDMQRMLKDRLDSLPSAQPEQRWIPCSEQLPEDEYVLISKLPTKVSGSKWSVAIAIRTADPRSRKIQWRDSGFGVIQDDKVLAWMPLPEPYKENDNG